MPALNATTINEPETLLDPSKFGIVGVEEALHKGLLRKIWRRITRG